MDRPKTSSIQSINTLIESRALNARQRLNAQGMVFYDDRILPEEQVRRAFWARSARDLWRIVEALLAIGFVAFIGFAFYSLTGLLLQ